MTKWQSFLAAYEYWIPTLSFAATLVCLVELIRELTRREHREGH